MKTLFFFLICFLLIQNAFSQSTVNENSPNSVIVQGNNNTVNYNNCDINEELLKRFQIYKLTEVQVINIFTEISNENKIDISQDLLNQYAQTIVDIYHTLPANATIKLNDTVYSITGNQHFFDIGIHANSFGHNVFMAVKLLPIERPAKISDILDFKLALDDIKAVKGIVFCNSGFSDELQQFASDNMIDLCVLKDVQSEFCLDSIEIPVIWQKSTPWFTFGFSVTLESGVKIPRNLTTAELSYDDGISTFNIIDFINDKWNNNQLPHITDSVYNISLKQGNLKLKSFNKGYIKVNEVDIYYTTREEYFIKYFKPDVFKAIENYSTKVVELSEIMVEIEFPDISESWKKIGEDIKEDGTEGEMSKLPNGITIVATSSIDELKFENFIFEENDMKIYQKE